jgi:PIN domain nuclease of toxin-antitoxin system
MRLVLDTHAFIWWIGALPGLTTKQLRALDATLADDDTVGLAAISAWEIARLIARGRIRADEDTIRRHLANPAIELLPLTPAIAFESTRLEKTVPKDPADQLIIATARVHGVPLLTADGPIRRSRSVPVI